MAIIKINPVQFSFCICSIKNLWGKWLSFNGPDVLPATQPTVPKQYMKHKPKQRPGLVLSSSITRFLTEVALLSSGQPNACTSKKMHRISRKYLAGKQ